MASTHPGERLAGETDLAYHYFCLYRDQAQRPRSLRELCQQEVNGKKRSLKVMGRWSAQYRWQERVSEWDLAESHRQLAQLVAKRQADIEAFAQEDFFISKGVQRLTSKKISALMTGSPAQVNATELRQVVLAYDVSRSWLIGFFSEEANRLGTSDLEPVEVSVSAGSAHDNNP